MNDSTKTERDVDVFSKRKILKSVIDAIDNPELVLKVTSEAIAADLDAWTLILEKSLLKLKPPSIKGETMLNAKEFNTALVKNVVHEVGLIFTEFKCFMEGCVEESNEVDQETEEIRLPDALRRGSNKPLDQRFKVLDYDSVSRSYKHLLMQEKEKIPNDLDLSGDRVSFVENVNIVYDGSDTDESCNDDAEVLEQNPDELFDRVENKTLSNFPKESGAAVSQKVLDQIPKRKPSGSGKPVQKINGRYFCKVPSCPHYPRKSYSSPTAAWYHYGSEHSDYGVVPCTFSCKICPKKFPSYGSLAYHKRLQHRKFRPSPSKTQ